MILAGLTVGGKSQLVGALEAGASGRSQGRNHLLWVRVHWRTAPDSEQELPSKIVFLYFCIYDIRYFRPLLFASTIREGHRMVGYGAQTWLE